MHFLEEEFKKRFQNARSAEGIDEEKLWAGIEAGLPPEKRDQRWLPLFLGAGLLMFLAAWFFFGQNKETQKPVLGASKTAQSPAAPNSETAKTDPKTVQNDIKIQIFNEKNERGQTEAASNFSQKQGFLNKFVPTETQSKFNNIYSKKDQPASIFEKIGQFETTQNVGEKPFLKEIFDETSPENAPKPALEPLFDQFDFSKIPTLTAQPIEFFGKRSLPILPEIAATAPILLTKNQPQKKWSVGILAGANLFSQKFSGETDVPGLSNSLKNATTPEIGSHFSFKINRKLNKTFHVGAGIGYSTVWSRFNFTEKWDTMMFRNNIPGNDLIRAEAVRTVENHNRASFFSLPLAMGATKKLGRFNAGIEAGIGLNYFISQKGKSLDATGKIAEFDSKNQLLKPFFISANVEPFVEFRLKSGSSAKVQPSFSFQNHGESAFFKLKNRSVFAGLGFGAFRQF